MRLVSLVLDRHGRLSDSAIFAIAVRGTLLVDLALRHRITDVGNAIEIDRQPTGFPPADRLLVSPIKSLDDVVRHGPVNQRDLAAEHVRRGTWSISGHWLRRRYIDESPEQTSRDKTRLTTNLSRLWDRADAALALVGLRLGVLSTSEPEPTEELLQASEPVRWLVQLTLDQIGWTRAVGQVMEAHPPTPPPVMGL
ncbi:MAG: hypothetical protein JWP40_856 [Blastococcus sp.]|nr:hypothetical protein [Blastococcus sp.]